MFTQAETFNHIIGEQGLASLEGLPYAPQRLVTPSAHFGLGKLVEHFIRCGLQPQDSTIFKDFMINYLTHVPQPAEPNWESLPLPCPITSRLTTQQHHKARAKEIKRVKRERSLAEAQRKNH